MEEYIKKYQEKFSCLNDWKIFYSEKHDTTLQSTIYPKEKVAIIHKWIPICKGEVCNQEKYVKHEILHIAISSIKNYEEREESFVIELTKMI